MGPEGGSYACLEGLAERDTGTARRTTDDGRDAADLMARADHSLAVA